MANIQEMATRLADMNRIRENLTTYSHPVDVAKAITSAMHYVGGTVDVQAVLGLLVDGLDSVIAETKDQMREALK